MIRVVLDSWVLVAALFVVSLGGATGEASGASSGATEAEAEVALHFAWSLEDVDRLHDLDTKIGQALAGGDPLGQAEAASLQVQYDVEQRGHPLTLEDCLGLGPAVRSGADVTYKRFRCRMTSILSPFRVLRETEVFTAADVKTLAAVPRPRGAGAAWSERLMEDRVISHARLVDPIFVNVTRQDVRQAEEELAGLQAASASQASLNAASVRLQQARRALKSELLGYKLRSATCVGRGPAVTAVGDRPRFRMFQCRVSARAGGLLRGFMIVESRSSSKLVVRRQEPLAIL